MSPEDPRAFALEMALRAARAGRDELEALAQDPALGAIVRRERRFRKGGEPIRARQRLADRLLAMPEPDQSQLREVLDEASFGDAPRDLCAAWLSWHARAQALRALGEASRYLLDREPAPALVDAASAWLSSPTEALPAALQQADASEAGHALRLAMDRWNASPSADVNGLAKALRAHTEPAVTVPLALWVMSCRDWKRRTRLARALGRSPHSVALLVTRLCESSADELSELLSMVPRGPDLLLACAVWSRLGEPELREGLVDTCYRTLGALGEPSALVDQLRPDLSFDLPMLDAVHPHPLVPRALLEMIGRKDKRLMQVWEQPKREEGSPPLGPYLWRAAISMVAEAARRWDCVPQARPALWKVLRQQLAHGGDPEDIRLLGLALGMMGDEGSLSFVLEALDRQGPRDSVCLALRALGERAQGALPRLEGSDDPWAWLAREAIEPHDGQWAHKLERWLQGEEVAQRVRDVLSHYEEGLITHLERRMALALQLEALACLQARGGLPPGLQALAAQLAPVVGAG